MSYICSATTLLARVCLSSVFIFAGVGKFMHPDATAAYMASKNIPMVSLLLYVAALVELIGGLSILLGYKTRWGAFLLLGFLVVVTGIFHDFWNLTGELQKLQMIMFMKNLAIAGGLLYVIGCGAGGCSCDASCECKSKS